MVHRVDPTTATAPILSIGPSELDYEFVKLGLQRWPWRSWFLYAGLVSCVAAHAADGLSIIWNTWVRGASVGKFKGASRNRRRATVLVGLAGPVLLGLYALAREPLMVFTSTARRFEAVFAGSFIYRI